MKIIKSNLMTDYYLLVPWSAALDICFFHVLLLEVYIFLCLHLVSCVESYLLTVCPVLNISFGLGLKRLCVCPTIHNHKSLVAIRIKIRIQKLFWQNKQFPSKPDSGSSKY